MGAKVTKVEAPEGDPNRRIDPAIAPDVGFIYGASNRGKRFLRLDLKRPAGRRRALRLAADADIVVQAFRPGTARRLGIDWSSARRANPHVLYLEVSGWGPRGEHAGEHGHDLAYQAASGMLDPKDPRMPTVGLADLFGSFWGAFLAVAGLREVAKTGRGRRIAISLVGSALVGGQLVRAASSAKGPEPAFLRGTDPHYALYECGDGRFLAVAVVEPQLRPRLRGLLRVRTSGTDPSLKRALAAGFRTRTRAEWLRRLRDADLPAAPVLSPMEAAKAWAGSGASLPPHDVLTGERRIAKRARSRVQTTWR